MGRDTPAGTVFRLPEGVYKVSEKKCTNSGCKVRFLVPVNPDLELPALVFFLPTQLDSYSFRQNLLRHIGADAVMTTLPRLETIFQELGVDEEHPAHFFGYSLGGVQASMVYRLNPKRVQKVFTTSSPGVEPEWQSLFNYVLPDDLADTEMIFAYNKRDGIPNYGGSQLWQGIGRYKGGDGPSPINVHVYEIRRGEDVKNLPLNYFFGNTFDVLSMTLRSFWGAHCATHALKKWAVTYHSNDTRGGTNWLERRSDTSKLRLEGVARRALVDLIAFFKNAKEEEPFWDHYLQTIQKLYPRKMRAYLRMIKEAKPDVYHDMATRLSLSVEPSLLPSTTAHRINLLFLRALVHTFL